MKKFAWMILFSVILIGCSDENVGEKQNTKKENNEVIKSAQNKVPFPIVQYSSGDTGYEALRYSSCWEGDNGKPCEKEPLDPKELLSDKGIVPMTTYSGKIVTLQLVYKSSESNFPPDPNLITVTQFRHGEKNGEVVATFNQRQKRNFKAPMEPGRYYYSVHLQWNDEIVGEADYAFYFLAREEK